MKRLFFLIAIAFLMAGCSDKDDENVDICLLYTSIVSMWRGRKRRRKRLIRKAREVHQRIAPPKNPTMTRNPRPLLVNEQEVTMKQFRREAKTAVSDFLHEVNHKLMGDFVSMSNEEIWRFQKMEKPVSYTHLDREKSFTSVVGWNINRSYRANYIISERTGTSIWN